MYFLLIRPQKKKERQINAMRSSIKVGDSIITIGGLCGIVTRVKDDTLIIQVGADKTRLEVTRWAISKLVDQGGSSPSRASKNRATEEVKDEQEPVKKAPRKRLDKTENPAVVDEPIEANPLEENSKESSL
jgi:preprotein translocase subunit YajC